MPELVSAPHLLSADDLSIWPVDKAEQVRHDIGVTSLRKLFTDYQTIAASNSIVH